MGLGSAQSIQSFITIPIFVFLALGIDSNVLYFYNFYSVTTLPFIED